MSILEIFYQLLDHFILTTYIVMNWNIYLYYLQKQDSMNSFWIHFNYISVSFFFFYQWLSNFLGSSKFVENQPSWFKSLFWTSSSSFFPSFILVRLKYLSITLTWLWINSTSFHFFFFLSLSHLCLEVQ